SMELYYPAAHSCAAAPNMGIARHGHQTFRLPDNNSILIVGGVSGGQASSSVEMYVQRRSTMKKIGDLNSIQSGVAGAPVSGSNKLMIAGASALSVTAKDASSGTITYPTVVTHR